MYFQELKKKMIPVSWVFVCRVTWGFMLDPVSRQDAVNPFRLRLHVACPLLWVVVQFSGWGLFHACSLELSLRILWVHSELEDPFSSPLYSSFLPFFSRHQALLFLVPLTRERGASLNGSSVQHFPAPGLGLALRTALPGQQPGRSSLLSLLQVLAFHHILSFFTFQKPQVVVFCILTHPLFSSAGEIHYRVHMPPC